MSTVAFLRVKFRKHKFVFFFLGALVCLMLFGYHGSDLVDIDNFVSDISGENSQSSGKDSHKQDIDYEEGQTEQIVESPGEKFSVEPMYAEDVGYSRAGKYIPSTQPEVQILPRKFTFELPESKKKSLPKPNYAATPYKIQASTFEEGGKADKQKLEAIKKVFLKSWMSYKKYAIDSDELLPLSHKGENPFVGWSITLIDTLDTLHLMKLEDEFEFAVQKVSKINFRKSPREYIPTFETVIRAFGGLVSAYDVSGDKRLLAKAVECGDMLSGIFDTPNNMPLLFYRWSDFDTSKPKFASTGGSVAEFGTLFLEFTRLAQITGNETYFHYVQNIIDNIDEYIMKEAEEYPDFELNGLLPTHMDTSGCELMEYPKTFTEEQKDTSKYLVAKSKNRKVLCKKTGIKQGPFNSLSYTLGGLADSYYEYLIKQHHMFNGENTQYMRMFKKATDKMKKYMFFKAKLPSIKLSESNTIPHLKTNPDDVLFLSEFEIKSVARPRTKQKTWISHLSCFAGGMFGLSSRINDDDEELEIAKKLTNGCYKMYELNEIMPEWSAVEACPEGTTEDDAACQFDVREKVKQIRKLTEELDTNFMSDSELLKNLQPNEAHSNRYDNLEEISPDLGQTDNKNDLTKKDMLHRVLNVKELNFDQYNAGRDAHKYDASKLKTFPKSTNAVPNRPFPEFISGTPSQKLSEGKNGDVFWNVGGKFNLPLWANEMDPKFILRPELIESMVYMYRITGDLEWREKAWKMLQNTLKHVEIEDGATALADVTHLYSVKGKLNHGNKVDSCESFWFAETLKYYYLMFEDKDVWSFDDYVFNTEAHPFKRSLD